MTARDDTPITVKQYSENVFRIEGELYVPLDDAHTVVYEARVELAE